MTSLSANTTPAMLILLSLLSMQAAQDSTKGGVVIVYTSVTFAFAQSIAFCYSSYSVSASATAVVSVGTSQATAFAQTASIASSQASAIAISSAYVILPIISPPPATYESKIMGP